MNFIVSTNLSLFLPVVVLAHDILKYQYTHMEALSRLSAFLLLIVILRHGSNNRQASWGLSGELKYDNNSDDYEYTATAALHDWGMIRVGGRVIM